MSLRQIKVNNSNIIGVDSYPTPASSNICESGGIYEELTINGFSSMSPEQFNVQNILSGNKLLNASIPHEVLELPTSSFGYCRTYSPIEIPLNYDYMRVAGTAWNDNPIKIGFYYTNTLEGESNSQLYQSSYNAVPISSYYKKGYRYMIIELLRGLASPPTDYSLVSIKFFNYGTSLKDIVIVSCQAEMYSNSSIRSIGTLCINNDWPYGIGTYAGSAASKFALTYFYQIPKNAKYIIYKGIYGIERCNVRFSVLAADDGDAISREIARDGSQEIIVLDNYSIYNYVVFTVGRCNEDEELYLSEVSIKFADDETIDYVSNNKIPFTSFPIVAPRKGCVVFQMDGNPLLFNNVIEYDNLLKNYDVNASSFVILSNTLSQYINTIKYLQSKENEIDVHGLGTSGDYDAILQEYIRTFYSYGIYDMFGYTELSTLISPSQLQIAKKYFAWIVKNGGDYGPLTSGYLDSVNMLSDKPYELKRLALELLHSEHTTENVNTAINNIKETIDYAISNKGVLVLYGHTYNQISGTTYTVYKDVLEPILVYLKEKLKNGLCLTGRTTDIINYFYSKRYDE